MIIDLFPLVFVLGLRHGVDADHLACIDGLTRYNWQERPRLAPWIGTLFSFGHGLVVMIIAVLLGMVTSHFRFPDFFTPMVTWVSVVSLFMIGSFNLYHLRRTKEQESEFRPRGIKVKWMPALLETSNPLLVVVIGGVFAMAADTVSQTSVWVLATGHGNGWLPLWLGLTFMIGMMITDTFDSWVVARLLSQTNRWGQKAARGMGWMIVCLAYCIGFYEAFVFFNPWAELNFEIVGLLIFVVILICFVLVGIKTNQNGIQEKMQRRQER